MFRLCERGTTTIFIHSNKKDQEGRVTKKVLQCNPEITQDAHYVDPFSRCGLGENIFRKYVYVESPQE